MYLHQIFQNMHQIACHIYMFIPSGIFFQIWDNLAPDFVNHINVLYFHWKILDLIALYDPLVVFNEWVKNRRIQLTCQFSSLDLSISVTFLFSCDIIEKKSLHLLVHSNVDRSYAFWSEYCDFRVILYGQWTSHLS